jgi:phosphocarrier protein HPr
VRVESETMNKAAANAILTNEVGLHARPSVKLTQLAKSYKASIELALAPEGPWTDAKSPVQVMRVKATKGSVLHVRAEGEDAHDAVAAVVDLVERKFGEE